MARAIIVGAGPAGATLAYLLSRRGVAVTLLERQTDFAREFRGEILMPSGIAALGEAGLGGPLDALPHLSFSKVEILNGERRIATIPAGNMDPPPRVVPQPAMLEMIVAEASRFPNFTLERGATVRDLVSIDGRVVGVAADTHEGTRELRGDFVIACDGRASVIRKRSQLPEDRIMQGFDVVWGHVPGVFLDGHTARAYIGHGHLLIMYQSPEGHLQIGWVIEKGTFGDIRRLGADGWIDAMAPYVSQDLREFVKANRGALTHPFLLDVICDRLREWTAPGLLLIGDSAHPMSPVGGQGINVALRDALVTSNILGRALSANADAATLDAAAHKVQAERWREIVTIQDLQQQGPRILFGGTRLSKMIVSAPVFWVARTFFASLIASRTRPFLYGLTEIRHEE